MAKYLIEVPHGAEKGECVRAVQIFLNSGSHFLAGADWGCFDGEHKAWMIVDVENKEQARSIVPPSYRPQATIVALNQFSFKLLDEVLSSHGP